VSTIETHIRGMGIACALGENARDALDALEQGRVRMDDVTLGFLAEPVRMRYFRIPDEAPVFEPERVERLLVSAAREAIESAELTRAEIESLPIFVGSSCFSVGRSETEYQARLRLEPRAAPALPYVGFQHAAAAIQERIGSRGDTYAFNTACTAGANALMSAQRMIRLGRHRNALVIGLEIANQTTLSGFSGLQLVADAVRPFDRRRSGIVLGESAAAVVLSSRGGASGITLAGGASNGDAFSVTTANPDGSTIAAVQRAALDQSESDVSRVRGIKSHGTASPLNDTGEAAGIARVFASPPPVCALKGYVGHTLGACGVSELVLLAGALENGFFPRTIGFEEADESLAIRPTREHVEARGGDYLLDYFGFGGNNTALVIRKA
jgi:3-oxoacyl-[acyl-carrier-protein] synthase-1